MKLIVFFLLSFSYLYFNFQSTASGNSDVCTELNWFMDKLVNDQGAIKGEKVYTSYDFSDPTYYLKSKATFNNFDGRFFESPNPYKIKRLEFHATYELSKREIVDQMVQEILEDALACLGGEYTQHKLGGDYPINELISHESEPELSEDSKKFHLSMKTEVYNDEYYLVISFYQPYVKKG